MAGQLKPLIVVAGVAIAMIGCRKEPEPAPLPPPKCAKVERGQDEPFVEVTCSGRDEDGDGVDDAVDLCPTLEETRDGVEDKDGCPDPDGDRDGVVDENDGCPTKKGAPPDGCPIVDTDGDGIPNHLDACPTRPEDKDGVQDADGCPEGERGATVDAVMRTTWREGIVRYRRGKTDPTDEGARVIADIIDQIEGAPEDVALVTVEIRTHPREMRRRSKLDAVIAARREAIADALTSVGVAKEKIEIKETLFPRRAAKRPAEIAVMLALTNAAAAKRMGDETPDAGVAAPEETSAAPGQQTSVPSEPPSEAEETAPNPEDSPF